MKLKIASFIGFAFAVIGIIYLFKMNYVFSKNIITIIIQVLSVGIMIWARLTFGLRSFHPTANTTKGELITKGPYRWLRHPIYASVIYFFIACIISFPFKETIAAVLLICIGLFIRILLEEKSLKLTYKEQYGVYSKKTKRIIPFIF
jgi:protein-S-isoprenylcysteine O-methyltransferase Ste14